MSYCVDISPLDKRVECWRSHFPQLERRVHDRPLVYLDNAATSLKPRDVIEAVQQYYLRDNANVHRANHALGHASTTVYEEARKAAARWIGASSEEEIIFTAGTTDSINALATALSKSYLQRGDVVLLSELEHHSNIVPWLELSQRMGIQLVYLPVAEDDDRIVTALVEHIERHRPRLLAVTHASNLTGRVLPVERMAEVARQYEVPVMVDGAQGIVHHRVDIDKLGLDFYAFSSHKLYGPMGIGVLYIRKKWHDLLPPFRFGGGMIDEVDYQSVTYAQAPYKYEAGTPHVAGAAGFRAALRFLESIHWEEALTYEQHLLRVAIDALRKLDGIRLLGHEGGSYDPIVSVYAPDVHHYDLAVLMDQMGVAVRAGHHCVQPYLKKLGLKGTVRISLAFYNTEEEVEYCADALKRSLQILTG